MIVLSKGILKWPQKTGQLAKVLPKPLKGYENGKALEFADQFKAKVALEALRGDKTEKEIAAKHDYTQTRLALESGRRLMGWLMSSRAASKAGQRMPNSKNSMTRSGGWWTRTIFCRKGSKSEPGKEAFDDPAGSPKSEFQSAMQTGAVGSLGVLPHAGRDRRGCVSDDE